MPCYPRLNQIGRAGATGGTETSKYPEEEKSTEIARVAASESAPAQTRARVSGRRCRPGVAGLTGRCCPPAGGYNSVRERNGMEGPAAAGESPVRETWRTIVEYPE